MKNSVIDEIPTKPIGALNKNNEMNKSRFGNEEEILEDKSILLNTIKITKQEKPKYLVTSFRLLDEDIKYIQKLAKENKVSPRDVLKSFIENYKASNK